MSNSVRSCGLVAYLAPLTLGFSRKEYWSGLTFPSPMHESEKWKWSHSVVSDSSLPHELQPTRLLHPCDFPGKSTGVGCCCLLCKEGLKRVKQHQTVCYIHMVNQEKLNVIFPRNQLSSRFHLLKFDHYEILKIRLVYG